MRHLLGVVASLAFVLTASGDVSDLVKKLSSADNIVRRKAADDLVELGAEAKAAIKPLIKALKDSDRFVRVSAARALGNVGPDAREAIPALTLALEDTGNGVRQAAIKALGRMGPSAIPALTKAVRSGASDIKEPAMDALAKSGKAGLPSLIDIVGDAKLDAAYRRLAVGGVVKMGEDARPALKVLVAAAKDPRARGTEAQQFRIDVFGALGTLATKSDSEAVTVLDSIVKDEKLRNNQIKNAARNALKRIQSK